MEAIAIPLRRLQEEASWFARAAEIKLLHVTADATLRGAAIKVLMAQEVHADNRAHMVPPRVRMTDSLN